MSRFWRRLRRFVLLFLWSFAFGGFLFYAGAVVPLGTNVLGTTAQGFVTRLVTNVINTATVITAAAFLVDLVIEWRYRTRRANWTLLCCLVVIGSCSAVLITLHANLDALLDHELMEVAESIRFYGLHRIYLWVSTLQWLGALPMLWILINSPAGEVGNH